MNKLTLLTLALITLSSTSIFSDPNNYGTGYSDPVINYHNYETVYADPIVLPSAPPAPEEEIYEYYSFINLPPLPLAVAIPQSNPYTNGNTTNHFHTHINESSKTSKLKTGAKIIGSAVALPFKLTGKMVRGLKSLYHLPKNLKKVLVPLAIIYGTDFVLNFAGNMGLLNFLPPEVNKLSGHIYPLINNGAIYTFKGIKLPFDILKGARLNATKTTIMDELNKPIENPQNLWATLRSYLKADPVTKKLNAIPTIARPAQVSTLKALLNARKNLRTLNCIKEATENSSSNGFIDATTFAKCFN